MINKKKRSNKLDSSPSLVVKEKKKGQRYRLPQSGITHRERVFDVGRPFSVCTDCTSPGEKELLARFCCSVRPPSFWQFFCHQRLFVPTLHFANMHLHWHSKKKKKNLRQKHTHKKKKSYVQFKSSTKCYRMREYVLYGEAECHFFRYHITKNRSRISFDCWKKKKKGKMIICGGRREIETI